MPPGRRRQTENNSGTVGCQTMKTQPNEKFLRNQSDLVLWKKPFKTLTYFFYELLYQVGRLAKKIIQYRLYILLTLFLIVSLLGLTYVEGPLQPVIGRCTKTAKWCLYWVGLGILSSVGLGTGLHTFLLYLGPHIASVTVAAYECGGLNFPEPPYPDKILCPAGVDPRWVTTVWNIMKKVWLEATMWGAGTALGELPPYFFAKTARLTGNGQEDIEELKELEKKKRNSQTLCLTDRIKLFVGKLIKRVGFFGILVCASVPNPMFDLAGIMCGHFLVPFWTFFGATLIGKAIIKVMIQKIVVIVAFNDALVSKILFFLKYLPKLGSIDLQNLFDLYLKKQKEKFHNPTDNSPQGSIDLIYNGFILVMIGYFVVSIVNALAQSYYKRTNSNRLSKEK